MNVASFHHMARNISVGIDIGTHQIKVVVAEYTKGKESRFPNIIGTGFVQSKGLRHGYIINQADAKRSVRAAVVQAEKASGVRIKDCYVSIGGVGLDEVRSRGEAIVSRADSEVTSLDIDNVIQDAEDRVKRQIMNRKIIHAIPLQFIIDKEPVLGRVEGMHGNKVEVDMLFVTALEQHVQDIISIIEDVGISVVDVMVSPIAASFVTLTKAQKTAGCVLANIGAETVSIVVFENGIPISVKVFPIGGTDITNDIALGLKVSLEEAENIKVGRYTGSSYPRKKLDEIISARLSDIFELIEAHLKSIGKNGLLPAGIIITGGGSGIATIEDLAKATLRLPSKKAHVNMGSQNKVQDASWAVAYGLSIWGFSSDDESSGITLARNTGKSLLSFFKQFLP